jgi:hypothetical protein
MAAREALCSVIGRWLFHNPVATGEISECLFDEMVALAVFLLHLEILPCCYRLASEN